MKVTRMILFFNRQWDKNSKFIPSFEIGGETFTFQSCIVQSNKVWSACYGRGTDGYIRMFEDTKVKSLHFSFHLLATEIYHK
jgi:hypothetical protein